MSNPTKHKRASRSVRWLDARVRSRRRPEVSAIISNISEAGCCIEAAAEYEAGEPIEIVVPRLGSISATVKWSEAGHSGAAFVVGSDRWLVPDPDAARYGANGAAGAPGPQAG
jgi:hypothetical protein